MEFRKSITALGILATAFLVIAVAIYAVDLFVISKTGLEGFLAANTNLVDVFKNLTNLGSNPDLLPTIIVFSVIGLVLILTIVWLVVDLRRHRKTVWLFLILLLITAYSELLYYFLGQPVFDFSGWETILPLGGYFSSHIAALLVLTLFVVDLATGKVEEPQAVTFYPEPEANEVEQGVFEEIKDESEVEEEKEEPSKEEEDTPEEVVEEKAEEKKKTSKKSSAKKGAKKSPAKKTSNKKEDVKASESEAAPAEKKETRKTQTITLVNEDGKVFAKAYHVSRRPELNKWQVKATGSDKALKLFNTQKEAIEYAEQLARSQNASIRVHSKEGKIRKHNSSGGKK